MSFSTVIKYGIFAQGDVIAPSPIPLSGLSAWYGDLVNSGIVRTTLSNGTAITQWDDQSGNAFHLNTIAGSTPTYDATNDLLNFTDGCLYNNAHPIITGSTNRTVFVVTQVSAISANNDNYFIGSYTASPASPGEYIETKVDNAAYATIDIASTYRRFTTTNAINTNYILTSYNTGTTISTFGMRKNGVNLAIGTTGFDYSVNTKVGMVGGGGYLRTSSTAVARGDVKNKEIIVYNRLLSTAEIEQVENYLNTKYSVY